MKKKLILFFKWMLFVSDTSNVQCISYKFTVRNWLYKKGKRFIYYNILYNTNFVYCDYKTEMKLVTK